MGLLTSSEPLHLAMVVLHTSPLASPGAADAGGMNVVVLNAAKALAKMGHKVDILARRDNPEVAEVVQIAPGLRQFHLPAGPPKSVAKSDSEILIEPFQQQLADWFNTHGEQISLIHSHHWFSGVAALPIANHYQIPHLQSFHSVAAPVGAELSAGEQPESAGRIAGERLSAQQSDLIIAVSQAEKTTIIDRYQVNPEKIKIVRPGVDLELFRPLAADEEPWDFAGNYLFFAARLQPLKGCELAIRTLAQLADKTDLRLVIAGATSADFDWYSAQLHQLVANLGLSQRVVFLGSLARDQFAEIMRGAKALINPSFSETFGIINLEAAASGIPVVAQRRPGLTESVLDGVTGLLVPSREPTDWAKAIWQVSANAKNRLKFAEAGRSFANSRSWSRVAQELVDLYRQEAK